MGSEDKRQVGYRLLDLTLEENRYPEPEYS